MFCFKSSVQARTFVGAGLLLGLIAITKPASAATYTWDQSGNATTFDGGGAWNTSGANWYTGASDQAWNNSTFDTAVFGAISGTTAYSVNLGTGITVGGITFQNQAYTIAGNTITLVGASPTITVNATGGTIGSILAGTGGFIKTGSGLLDLTGSNAYTGTTTVTGGTLLTSGLIAGSLNGNVGGNQFSTTGLNVSGGAVANLNMAGKNFSSANTGTTLSGAGTILLSGGTWWLGNNGNGGNPGAGGTTVAMSPGGLISVQAGAELKNDYANGYWANNLGSLNVASGASFDLRNNNTTIDALSGAGALFDNGFTNTLTIGVAGGSGSFTGTIGPGGTTVFLVKTGSGAETLSGANTYTGSTTINGGTLNLNFSAAGAPTNNIISSASALALGGGELLIQGNNSATNSQTVNGTTVNAGYSPVVVSSGSGGTANLTLGAITRNAGGFVDFTLATSGAISTTATNSASGILGPWATVGGANWAANNGSNQIVAYSGYANIPATGGTISSGSTTNVQLNAAGSGGNITLGSATTTINTLLQGTSTAGTVATAGGTLQVAGIMVGGGQAALTVGANPGDGVLTAATAGGELALINNSTNPLTINAPIANNSSASALSVSGSGVVSLAGTGTYTGTTTVSSGTLQYPTGASFTDSITTGGHFATRGGAVSVSGGNLNLYSPYFYTGALNVSAGTLTTQNYPIFGDAPGAFTWNQSGGTTMIGGGNAAMDVAWTAGSNVTLNFSGGVVKANGFWSTNGGGSTTAAISTLNMSGSALFAVTAPNSSYNLYTGNGTSNFNLNGGTLSLPGWVYNLGNNSAGTVNWNFNGGTFLASGAVTFPSASAISTTIGAGGALFNPGGNTITMQSSLGGVGGVTENGSGTLILSNSNTYQGTTTVNGGYLVLSSSAGVAVPGNILLSNSTADGLWFTVNNQLSGTGTLSFDTSTASNARFMLEATNQSLAGINGTSPNSVVQNSEPGIAGPTASGTGVLTLTGSGAYAYNGYFRSQTGVLALTMAGTGGQQTLSGANIIYTGPTTISGGTLGLQNTTAFASPVTVNPGGVLSLNNVNNGFASRVRMTNTISGAGTLNVNSGTSGINGGWIIFGSATTGLSNFTGTINVNSGVLAMDNVAGIWSGNPTVNVYSGGLLAIRAQSISIDALNGNGDVFNSNTTNGASGETLTIGANNGSGTFTGNIHGNTPSGGSDGAINQGITNITKSGSGMETFSGGALTYTGTTGVTGGSLALVNMGNNFISSTTISPAATLILSTTAGNLSTGSVDLNTIGYNNTGTTLTGSGTLVKTGTGWTEFDYNVIQGFAGQINVQAGILGNGFGRSIWGTSVTGMGVNVSPGAMLDIRGNGITVGALNGSGSVVNTYTDFASIGNGVLTVGVGGASSTFSGSIIGNGLGSVNNTPNAGVTSLTKTGSGIFALAGSNVYSGATTINGGTLQVGAGGAAGTLGSGSVVNKGVLAFARSDSGMVVANAISGSGSVVQLGSGITALSGANGYSGGTTVSAGTLQVLTGGSMGTGNITVTPGAVLDLSPYGGAGYTLPSGVVLTAGRTASLATDVNGPLNVNNATISVAGGSNSGTLTVGGNLALNGATVSIGQGGSIALGGNLTLTNTDYISPTQQLATGTYPLFSYSGMLTGGTQDLAMAGGFLSNRQTYMFNATAGAITLSVSGAPASLQWTGAGSGVWYAGSGATNWYNLGTSASDNFYTGDNVTFSDSGSASPSVTISGLVQPGSVIVSNTASSYTFTGTGSIGGAATVLTMNGPNSLTISTSNTYSGGTSLTGGTLYANAFYALGTGTVGVSGGLLAAGAAQATGSGAITVSGGTLTATAAQSPSSVHLTSGAINAAAIGALGSGAVVQNGGVLNLNFAQSVSSVTLNSGLLTANDPGALGSGTVTISGGTLDNTSGNPITLSTNYAMNWNGDFTFAGSNPLNLGTGSLVLSSSRNVTVSGSGALSFGGSLAGVNGLAKSGSGTLVLTGGQLTYSGPTTIDAGTLKLLNLTNATFASPTTVLPGATLEISNTTSGFAARRTIGAVFSGGGTVNVTGGGWTSLYGNISLSGDINVSGSSVLTSDNLTANWTNNTAVLNIAAGSEFHSRGQNSTFGTLIGAGAVGNDNTSATAVFTIGKDNGSGTFTGVIHGDNSNGSDGNIDHGVLALTKAGSGVQTLTGANTYSGATTISGGTLQIGGGGVLAGGNYGAAVTDNGALVLSTSSNQMLTGGVSGSGALYQLGSGTTTLSGAAITYSGTTAVNSGTLVLQNATAFNSSIVNNATLQLDLSAGTTWSPGAITFSGSGLLLKTSPGTVNFGNQNLNTFISMSPGGLIDIQNGTLRNNDVKGLWAANQASMLVESAGTLDLFANNVNVDALNGSGTVQNSYVPNGVNTLTVGVAGGSGTFSGSILGIGGNVAVTKTGIGTQTLSGGNSYGGGTTVSGGTLNATNDAALGAGTGGVNMNPTVAATLAFTSGSPAIGSLAGSGVGTSSVVLGNLTNATSTTLTIGAANATTAFAGTISDLSLANSAAIGGLTKTGATGVLYLDGTNTYTGTTTVNAGYLVLRNSNALNGTSGVQVSNGATLQMDISETITGKSVTLNGNGVGGNRGALAAWANASGTWAGPVVLGSNSSLLANSSGTLTVSGNISESSPGLGITIVGSPNGNGRVVLSGTNTYSGLTSINGGTLALGNSLALQNSTLDTSGTGRLSFTTLTAATFGGLQGSGSLALNNATPSAVALSVGNNNASTTFSGALSGSGSLVKIGSGVTTFSGNNSALTGAMIVNSGVLQLGNSAALGTGSLAANGGTLDLAGYSVTVPSFSGASGVVTTSVSGLATFTVNQSTTTFSGAINDGAGQIALNLTGSGTLTLANTNAYSGGTIVAAGTLKMGTANALPYGANAGNVAVNGLLDVAGQTTSVNGLSGTGAIDNTTGTGTLVVGNNNATSTFSGVLQNTAGSLGLTKVGNGTFTLASTNSYVGATTVQAGVLALGAYGAPSSPVSVTGGTLDASGFAQNIASLSMGSLGSLNLAVGNLLASTGLDNFGGTLNVSGDTGAVVLATYGSLGAGRFAGFTGLQGGYTLSYGATDLAIVSSGPPTWQFATSGSWTDGTKWSSAAAPGGNGQTAIVGATTTSPWTITLDSPQTLGSLTFTNTTSNAAGYTLATGVSGSLTLDNTGSTAQIVVNGGSHAISAPVYLVGGDLTIAASNGGVLTISGSISQDTTRNLTLNGDGTGELILSGTNNFGGSGAVATVSSGTLVLDSNEALVDGSSLTVGDASFFGSILPASSAGLSAGALASQLAVTPVPEPGTLLLVVSGLLAGIATWRRTRYRGN